METIQGASSALDGLLTAIAPFANQAFLFLLIYVGLRLVLGFGDIREILASLFKIAFISTILFSTHYGFQEFIVPNISGARDFLISVFSPGSSGETIYNKLDKLINMGLSISHAAFNQFNYKDSVTYILGFWGIVILILSIIISAIMTFVMLGAELILLLLILIGPLFVVLFLFTSTRNFFFLWISAVFANIMLFVISSFFISLALVALNNIVEKEGIIQRLQASSIVDNVAKVNYAIQQSEYQDFVRDRGAQRIALVEQRDRALTENGCSTGAIHISSNCSDIYKDHTSVIRAHDEESRILRDELIDKYDKEYENYENLVEEPMNHVIFMGIALLLAILIKVTAEIPNVAQTLSGGAAAGSSASALVKTAIAGAVGAAATLTSLALLPIPTPGGGENRDGHTRTTSKNALGHAAALTGKGIMAAGAIVTAGANALGMGRAVDAVQDTRRGLANAASGILHAPSATVGMLKSYNENKAIERAGKSEAKKAEDVTNRQNNVAKNDPKVNVQNTVNNNTTPTAVVNQQSNANNVIGKQENTPTLIEGKEGTKGREGKEGGKNNDAHSDAVLKEPPREIKSPSPKNPSKADPGLKFYETESPASHNPHAQSSQQRRQPPPTQPENNAQLSDKSSLERNRSFNSTMQDDRKNDPKK